MSLGYQLVITMPSSPLRKLLPLQILISMVNTDFGDWIFNQGLIDLGFTRPKFTWTRGQFSETFKGARLDTVHFEISLGRTGSTLLQFPTSRGYVQIMLSSCYFIQGHS